jgi:D-threo-aldose 1-dehydrogenase
MNALGRGGLQVGALAFGCAPIGNLGRVVGDDEWPGALDAAYESGVRYFDTAPHYGLGLAERRLGEKLREDCIVSTKVGRVLVPGPGDGMDDEGYAVPTTQVRVRDYSRDGILRSLEASLERLGRDRVDLLFVHDPDDFYREALTGAFPALEELRSQGVIASYGAGMNQAEMLAAFVRETDLDVIMLAGRYTLLEQGALDDLLPECERRGVSVVAAGVFNSGLLARERPSADATYNYEPAPPEILARVHRIADVLERHGTTLPVAAAQFALAHPAVATVCLGARDRAQVERNAALFDQPVPAQAWEELMAEGLLRETAPVPA